MYCHPFAFMRACLRSPDKKAYRTDFILIFALTILFSRWAYFGSETGMYRIFPGHEWDVNFAGFRPEFDPRVRPWYLSATSGPKNVAIFLDCSRSMNYDDR